MSFQSKKYTGILFCGDLALCTSKMDIRTRLPHSQTNIADNLPEAYHSEGDESTPRQLADLKNTHLPETELEADYDDEEEIDEVEEEHLESLEASTMAPFDKEMLVSTNGLTVRAETGLDVSFEGTNTALQAIKAIRHATMTAQISKAKDVPNITERMVDQTSKAFVQASTTSVSYNKKHSHDSPAVSPKKHPTFQTDQTSLNNTIQHPALDALPRSKEVLPSPNVSPDAGSICLCQPMPKIPRPRNGRSMPEYSRCFLRASADFAQTIAFILYRQHQHPAVVAQNPGKPNPEISKIIGAMWKEGSQDTRDLWLKHAEVSMRSGVAEPSTDPQL